MFYFLCRASYAPLNCSRFFQPFWIRARRATFNSRTDPSHPLHDNRYETMANWTSDPCVKGEALVQLLQYHLEADNRTPLTKWNDSTGWLQSDPDIVWPDVPVPVPAPGRSSSPDSNSGLGSGSGSDSNSDSHVDAEPAQPPCDKIIVYSAFPSSSGLLDDVSRISDSRELYSRLFPGSRTLRYRRPPPLQFNLRSGYSLQNSNIMEELYTRANRTSYPRDLRPCANRLEPARWEYPHYFGERSHPDPPCLGFTYGTGGFNRTRCGHCKPFVSFTGVSCVTAR